MEKMICYKIGTFNLSHMHHKPLLAPPPILKSSEHHVGGFGREKWWEWKLNILFFCLVTMSWLPIHHVVATFWPRAIFCISTCHTVASFLPCHGTLFPIATYFGHRAMASISSRHEAKYIVILSFIEHSPRCGTQPTVLWFWLDNTPLGWFHSNLETTFL